MLRNRGSAARALVAQTRPLGHAALVLSVINDGQGFCAFEKFADVSYCLCTRFCRTISRRSAGSYYAFASAGGVN